MIGRERFGNKLPKGVEPTPPVPATPTGPPKSSPPKAKVVSKPTKNKPPVVKVEMVTCTCGHQAEFGWFPDKQDKFRDRRREKLVQQACPTCRQTKHAALIAQQKAEAAERRKQKVDKGRMVPRLPNGSRFTCRYYEAPQPHWKGELHIPDGGGTTIAKVFSGEASGVFTLQVKLDKEYRQWLKELSGQQGEQP